MKARVKWVEGKTFLGESNSGHTVTMSAPMKSLSLLPPPFMVISALGATSTPMNSPLPLKVKVLTLAVHSSLKFSA